MRARTYAYVYILLDSEPRFEYHLSMVTFPEPFCYTSRDCWDKIHTTNWSRAYIVAQRRCGKTYALVAETIKRAYNCEKNNPQYLFLSPLAEQTEANILGMCQGQAQAYIKEWRSQDKALILLNGAVIWFGGARSAEKFRGRYLDGCFSGNTDVLTERGWLPFKEAVSIQGLRFAQFNQNTGRVSFAQPNKLFEFFDRDVMELGFGAQGTITCTPNHQWLVADGRTIDQFKKIDADKLNGHHCIPRAALVVDKTKKLTPWQRLAIAVQADAWAGSLAKDTITYRVKLKKQRKIDRFVQILNDCGIVATPHPTKAGELFFNFTLPKRMNITKDLTTFFDLNTVPAYDFLQEIKYWDGSTFGDGGIYYSSIVKKNVDFVQAVAVLAGYRTRQTKQVDNRKSEFSDVYRLFCSTTPMPRSGPISSKTYLNERQTVYCVEMPEHNIIVRTDKGAAFVTGNCVVDERANIEDYVLNDILHFCLMDRKGWLAVCGTARADDDYKLYRGYKEALKPGSGYDLVMKLGCNESGVLQKYYNMDPVKAKEDYVKQAMANGSSYQQALQSWMCEMECDFSFIDEGRPNMNALLYNEMQALFESQPPRLLQVPATPRQSAVFDLASGGGRDYTTAVFVTQDNNISGIHYTNTKTMQDWITALKAAGVDTVVLPFDAKQRNRDTGMSTVDFMTNAGFRVIVLKRLLRIEQEEHARWLLNSVSFDYNNCVDALRELGKFTTWQAKHKLDQDVMSAICYAGQYVRKKGIKEERRKTWYQQMNQSRAARNNPNEQSNMMVGLSGPAFF